MIRFLNRTHNFKTFLNIFKVKSIIRHEIIVSVFIILILSWNLNLIEAFFEQKVLNS